MCVYQRVPWLAGVSEEVRLAEGEVGDHSSVKVAAQMRSAVVFLLVQLGNRDIETDITIKYIFVSVQLLMQPATNIILSCPSFHYG